MPKEDEFPEDMHVEGFWDDVNGGWLPEKLVKAARQEELEWVHRREVYRKVDEQECFQVTGKPHISALGRYQQGQFGQAEHSKSVGCARAEVQNA